MNRFFICPIMIFAFMLCFGNKGYAQKKETIQMRIHYATKFFLYEGQEMEQLDETILDIGENMSHFYSLNSIQRELITDSIVAKGGNMGDVLNALEKSNYHKTSLHYQVWKNYPSINMLTYTDKAIKRFQYTEAMERPKWTLNAKDSVITNYKCQQAETFYLGRKWYVWFTLEIPVQEGPWKLYGLPGLILYAEDSDHLFSFLCIQVENVPNTKFRYSNKKHIQCTKEEYKELIKLQWKDPMAFSEKITGFRGKAQGANGKSISYTEKTALFLDK